ncbi:hypothetical protein EAG_07843 [Camponotus floridanus]|uniref:Uncharacterized protein n=1 Tax=Camponotus floridanus TaxID=104421 RepID=E2AT70_CAMFO|nr:hypothetical protein EAG_07843 [Camponotus floridanus]
MPDGESTPQMCGCAFPHARNPHAHTRYAALSRSTIRSAQFYPTTQIKEWLPNLIQSTYISRYTGCPRLNESAVNECPKTHNQSFKDRFLGSFGDDFSSCKNSKSPWVGKPISLINCTENEIASSMKLKKTRGKNALPAFKICFFKIQEYPIEGEIGSALAWNVRENILNISYELFEPFFHSRVLRAQYVKCGFIRARPLIRTIAEIQAIRQRICQQNCKCVWGKCTTQGRADIDFTAIEKDSESGDGTKPAFSTTPRCINGPAAMLEEADEAEESEEP